MSWLEDISSALKYVEENIKDEITMEDIANHVNMSSFYFQKGFTLLCGITLTEYIRNRRLSLAGRDIQAGKKVIDVSLDYGYDSPDSFTKAFTRFHGVTPSDAKKGMNLKYYLPLKIELELKGGFKMNVKIVKKNKMSLVGYSKMIGFNEGYQECPKMWDEHYALGRGKYISGEYGICLDMDAKDNKFRYLIADSFNESKEYPADIEHVEIEENVWAVFPCVGPMPKAMQDVNTSIFKEWLPNNPDYEIACELSVEYYSNPMDYEGGCSNSKYYSEIWVPVKAKK